jgi:hypothetical protein
MVAGRGEQVARAKEEFKGKKDSALSRKKLGADS